jgi:hypothetical protein
MRWPWAKSPCCSITSSCAACTTAAAAAAGVAPVALVVPGAVGFRDAILVRQGPRHRGARPPCRRIQRRLLSYRRRRARRLRPQRRRFQLPARPEGPRLPADRAPVLARSPIVRRAVGAIAADPDRRAAEPRAPLKVRAPPLARPLAPGRLQLRGRRRRLARRRRQAPLPARARRRPHGAQRPFADFRLHPLGSVRRRVQVAPVDRRPPMIRIASASISGRFATRCSSSSYRKGSGRS